MCYQRYTQKRYETRLKQTVEVCNVLFISDVHCLEKHPYEYVLLTRDLAIRRNTVASKYLEDLPGGRSSLFSSLTPTTTSSLVSAPDDDVVVCVSCKKNKCSAREGPDLSSAAEKLKRLL